MKISTSIASIILIFLMAFSAKASAPGVYLAGPFNFYGFMGSFSDKWLFSSDDDVVYKGTFNIPADKLIFCVYDYVDEDNYKIYGSQAREGGRVYITFEEENDVFSTELRYAGQGDWAYEDWPGGEVSFEVDFGQVPPMVKVSTLVNPVTGETGAGIGRVDEAIKAGHIIYNLHGLPVDAGHLTPGLYIVDGRKVLIRN